MTRAYLVQHDDAESIFFVLARSPAAAAAKIGNMIIPSKFRWGSTVKVTTLESESALDNVYRKIRTYRVHTDRIVKRIEELRE